MMAIIAAQKSNLSLNKILAVIPKIRSVEGRLEKIGNIKNKSKVILDYAHTPDALKIFVHIGGPHFLEEHYQMV